ncbi:MAG: PhoU domain-containing protein [Clostridia bacterium]|nr:PhoU domain-containing protein [Clostridia bacterium]
MDDRILKTPSVAISQVFNQTYEITQQSAIALELSVNAFLSQDNSGRTRLDEITNMVLQRSEAITDFLAKLNACPLNNNERVKLSYLQHVLSDVERICDLADNIMRYCETVKSSNIDLSQNAYEEISTMYKSVKAMFELTLQDMLTRSGNNKSKIDSMENDIDNMRSNYINNHIARMNMGECKPNSSGIYVNTISNLERTADHLVFISKYPMQR